LQVTAEGTILVSNVVASCYIQELRAPILHWTTMFANNWLRLFGARQDGRIPVVWQALQELQSIFA
jgi:hypothetical protein